MDVSADIGPGMLEHVLRGGFVQVIEPFAPTRSNEFADALTTHGTVVGSNR